VNLALLTVKPPNCLLDFCFLNAFSSLVFSFFRPVHSWDSSSELQCFPLKLEFFNYFNILISKINFKKLKIYIILIYF
jgi:hypothetical protein